MAGLTAELVICVCDLIGNNPFRSGCCDDYENPGIQVRPIRYRELRSPHGLGGPRVRRRSVRECLSPVTR